MASTERRLLLASVLASVACRPEYDLISPVDVDPAVVLPCDFTALPDAPLRAYDCNPVFTGTDEAWTTDLGAVAFRAQPILGHPVYQLWYTSPRQPDGGGWALGHAISTNGVDWTPHPANPLIESRGAGWDADAMEQLAVVWDPGDRSYTLAYQGYHLQEPDNSFGLGVLTAPDGVSFQRSDTEPVLDLSVVHNGVDYCWPLSLEFADNRYEGLLAGHEAGRQVCEIYAFSAPDVTVPFTLVSERVLAAGPESYDQAGMASAALVPASDDQPAMLFYVGFEDWRTVTGNVVTPVGYSLNVAILEGGVWRKHPLNPLPIGTAGTGPTHVAAQRLGDRVHLWVTTDHPELGQFAVDYFLWDTTTTE